MENYLKLKFNLDNDGTGELIAEVSSNGYRGAGSAWFGVEALLEFASRLKTYPIQKESPIELIGGYLNKKGVRELKGIHFSFKAYPIGARGNVGVHIRVATDLGEHGRPESQHFVEVEIPTLYNNLEVFANELKLLINGKVKEAVLTGE